MEWWIWLGLGVLIVAALTLSVRRGWVDLSDKTRKGKPSGSAVMMIGDEVFAPRKYEAQIEQERQARLPTPAPLAGDPDKGISYAAADAEAGAPNRFKGSIRLDVER
ncbi:hypothetical protein SAMN05428970_0477 [Agromyces sp. CF514]|uniref:hypothetical protein n=1 Tax=Agromyces sp. CF514 TaxID=1881031 RepID=UPI0008E42D27|nr:hypothetical protein [Agromyces sp. CF514]SFR68645.1 hypothetical protein SAMN05428970_0477 [Agromyces sp. CF514]